MHGRVEAKSFQHDCSIVSFCGRENKVYIFLKKYGKGVRSFISPSKLCPLAEEEEVTFSSRLFRVAVGNSSDWQSPRLLPSFPGSGARDRRRSTRRDKNDSVCLAYRDRTFCLFVRFARNAVRRRPNRNALKTGQQRLHKTREPFHSKVKKVRSLNLLKRNV